MQGELYHYSSDRFSEVFKIVGVRNERPDEPGSSREVVAAFGPAMADVEMQRRRQELGTDWPHGRLTFWKEEGLSPGRAS